MKRKNLRLQAEELEEEADEIHHIHKEKYDLLRQVMNSSKQFCSLTFDTEGRLVKAESDISKQRSK